MISLDFFYIVLMEIETLSSVQKHLLHLLNTQVLFSLIKTLLVIP